VVTAKAADAGGAASGAELQNEKRAGMARFWLEWTRSGQAATAVGCWLA
jgi:hypothetical protein